MFAYILQYFCCYFALKQYNKGYILYLKYSRAINTTYSTRQLPRPTYYKETILNNFLKEHYIRNSNTGIF